MIIIPSLPITDARLTYSSAYEVAPADYSAIATYAVDDDVAVPGAAGLITVYRSIQAANIGNDPATSPTFWRRWCETYAVYSGGTTYADGDRVIDSSAHLAYRSLASGNVGNALTDTSKWFLLGATNRWAMFDLDRSIGTRQASPLVIKIEPGVRTNAIGLFGVVGAQAHASVMVGAAQVFDRTVSLTGREVLSWRDYFFSGFRQVPSVLMLNVPPYANAEITITITGSDDVSCGSCVVGNELYLGETELSAQSPGLNFSSIDRDPTFGTSKLTRRRTVPKTTQTVLSPAALARRLMQAREDLNGKPAVYSGLDGLVDHPYFDFMIILGVYKRFDIDLSLPNDIKTTLEIEEL